MLLEELPLGASERYPQTPTSEKRDYPVDPSLPDIKNNLHSDEFMMFSFKVKPCSGAYSHDWTECPSIHPGENARRRDLKKYHYNCVPCPEFCKGACRRGDLCEYAHGVFECWLHPAQYRTRLCKDGTACNRRVCFFAHTQDELRPLYLNLGTSTVSSPRLGAGASSVMVMDMAAALGMLHESPLSPSGNGMAAWNQQDNVPSLHLSGSRLRATLNARDMAMDHEIAVLQEMEHQQLLSDISGFSANHSRLNMNLKSLAPANLDDLFSSEMSLSPRYEHQAAARSSPLPSSTPASSTSAPSRGPCVFGRPPALPSSPPSSPAPPSSEPSSSPPPSPSQMTERERCDMICK